MIYGTAAKSLQGADWGHSQGAMVAGARGEQRTESLLNAVETEFPTLAVFHDVVVPNPRRQRYNIDHIVVAGDRVLLVDTKVWRPGFLWTVGGKTRNGFQRFPSADKRSVAAAYDDIAALVTPKGAVMQRPLIVVWSRGSLSLWAAKMPGGKLCTPKTLQAEVRKLASKKKTANPAVVAALRQHLAS